MTPRLVVALISSILLCACDTLTELMEEEDAPPIEGERISILTLDPPPKADPRIADLRVRLPAPQPNRDWPQVGGYPDHAMHHLAVDGPLVPAWTAGIGEGASDEFRLTATPVVARGTVYTLDAEGMVSAFAAASGKSKWQVQAVAEDDEEDALGGGLAFYRGRLFVTSGVGEVVALDAEDGTEVWRQGVGAPLRAAPTVSDNRLFVISNDNRLFALDATDGTELWRHQGITESARLLGAASPAVAGELVIVAYSSGEIFALGVENGRVAWADVLTFASRVSTLATLSDITGSPVVDRGQVFALSHAGRFVAINLRRGVRIWDQEISGVHTPWIAGDFLYVLTTGGDLLCLSRRDGRIRWVGLLPRFDDPVDRTGPIFWNGPVLVSDRLIVTGSRGEALAISPYDGHILGRVEFDDGVELAPVVADGALYVLTNEGELVALR